MGDYVFGLICGIAAVSLLTCSNASDNQEKGREQVHQGEWQCKTLPDSVIYCWDKADEK